MKEVVVIKKHGGFKTGTTLWVTDRTAEKRIKEGLCALKEEKEVIDTKEEKAVTETKVRKTKAPK